MQHDTLLALGGPAPGCPHTSGHLLPPPLWPPPCAHAPWAAWYTHHRMHPAQSSHRQSPSHTGHSHRIMPWPPLANCWDTSMCVCLPCTTQLQSADLVWVASGYWLFDIGILVLPGNRSQIRLKNLDQGTTLHYLDLPSLTQVHPIPLNSKIGRNREVAWLRTGEVLVS